MKNLNRARCQNSQKTNAPQPGKVREKAPGKESEKTTVPPTDDLVKARHDLSEAIDQATTLLDLLGTERSVMAQNNYAGLFGSSTARGSQSLTLDASLKLIDNFRMLCLRMEQRLPELKPKPLTTAAL